VRTCALFLMIALTTNIDAAVVEAYAPFYGTALCPDSPDTLLILRKFRSDGITRFLIVNAGDLSTNVRDSSSLTISPMPWTQIRKRYLATPYCKALADAEAHALSMEDAGITHFLRTQPGIDLTIDLCPSKRPLDRILFTDLFAEFGKVERPVPLAISVTAVWMKEHPDDLAWLLGLLKSRDIAVTWVNHTCHHRVAKELPIPENFILEKGTDVSTEILCTEKTMLESGMLPSVFFRFPGLVSDAQVFQTVTGYGLIPVGSDAWLAKNQKATRGSIVLVHANGNEPVGIREFITLLRQEQRNISAKRWLLFDLRESTVQEEVQKP
jgi:hypothetical protein